MVIEWVPKGGAYYPGFYPFATSLCGVRDSVLSKYDYVQAIHNPWCELLFSVIPCAKILTDERVYVTLMQAIRAVKVQFPFFIETFVLLPDHLHCVWTLPEDDEDEDRRFDEPV